MPLPILYEIYMYVIDFIEYFISVGGTIPILRNFQ
jgi:hypothetical protein